MVQHFQNVIDIFPSSNLFIFFRIVIIVIGDKSDHFIYTTMHFNDSFIKIWFHDKILILKTTIFNSKGLLNIFTKDLEIVRKQQGL